jgi:hypothetical protein
MSSDGTSKAPLQNPTKPWWAIATFFGVGFLKPGPRNQIGVFYFERVIVFQRSHERRHIWGQVLAQFGAIQPKR